MPYKDPKDPRAVQKRKERYQKYKAAYPERYEKYRREWKEKNPERHKEINAKYRENNREKLRVMAKNDYRKHIDKRRVYYKEKVSNLTDAYVKDKLRQEGFPKEVRNNIELIKTKKILIKTNRIWKTSKN